MRQRFAVWSAEKLTGPSKRMRASQFDQLPVKAGDIVFLGDSITEGGLWNEWFAGLPTKNRGIGGDSTRGVIERLDSAIANGPAAVFLLIGTNDLVVGVRDDEIVGNVREIVKRICESSPHTRVFVESIMPRKPKFAERIQTINRRLEAVARAEGATWIDLWGLLDDASGSIRSDFTLDKLHLNGAGYAKWVDRLRPFVEDITSHAQPD